MKTHENAQFHTETNGYENVVDESFRNLVRPFLE